MRCSTNLNICRTPGRWIDCTSHLSIVQTDAGGFGSMSRSPDGFEALFTSESTVVASATVTTAHTTGRTRMHIPHRAADRATGKMKKRPCHGSYTMVAASSTSQTNGAAA